MNVAKAIVPVGLGVICICAQAQQDPPFALPDGVEWQQDLVYSSPDGRDLTLDLFLPEPNAESRPAVVFIHGGGWQAGTKSHLMRQAAYLAERGVVTACIEYRLSDEATFPAALHDAKSAVRWLRANADRFDIDPARIGASGGSAGGHLAALLGTTANVPEFEGHENLGLASDVRVVVAFNPALDLLEIAKLRAAQGRPEEEATKFLGVGHAESPSTWDNASPISHVGPNSAQFLLLHGTDDETVPYQNSVDMLERLEAEGIHAELFTAEGAEHAFFNSSPWYAPATQKMAEFFLATL